MAGLFLRDLEAAVSWLDDLSGPMPVEEQPGSFAH
jgi:glutamate decarboxylase